MRSIRLNEDQIAILKAVLDREGLNIERALDAGNGFEEDEDFEVERNNLKNINNIISQL